ncbi:MAG TPA: adenylate/guanylate cyclase domain-containing protein, partial [Anaerolineales bacterium]
MMPDLSLRTITFLFTDIEGSTALWERDPQAMSQALGRHHAILHAAIEGNNGEVFNIVGDGFCAAFESPGSALAAALQAQRELAAQDWGAIGPVRVRMGIHTGPVEVQDGEYLSGPTLNRVSRVMAAGHGGQVLFSSAAKE